ESWNVGGEPGEVLRFTPAGQAREDMVDAEEDLALGQIHQQGNKVLTAALNLDMIPGGDGVGTDVQLGSAGHRHGYFLAHEEVGVAAEMFGYFNRIMVCDCDHGHAEAL